jgi:hypothetical protein
MLAGPPPLTHASTSDNLHFHSRPTRWAGNALFSIQRYTVSAATPRCAATSFTEDQRNSPEGLLSEIDIDRLLWQKIGKKCIRIMLPWTRTAVEPQH